MYGALSYLLYFWDLEEQRVGDTLKSSSGWHNKSQKQGGGRAGGNSTGEEGGGFPLCNSVVLKLYCKSYWVL